MLCLKMKTGSQIRITTPDGQVIVFELLKKGSSASGVGIQAPKNYKILRHDPVTQGRTITQEPSNV